MIISNFIINEASLSKTAYYLFNISAVTTSIYTAKVIYYLFIDSDKFLFSKKIKNVMIYKNEDWSILFLYGVCVVLVLFSVFSGYLSYEIFVEDFMCFSNEFLQKIIQELPTIRINVETSTFYYMFCTFFAINFWITLLELVFFLEFDIFLKKFFFNELDRFCVFFFLALNYVLSVFFDKQIVEAIISNLWKLDFNIDNYPTVYFKTEFLLYIFIIIEIIFIHSIIPFSVSDIIILLYLISQADIAIAFSDKIVSKFEKKK